MVGKRFAHNGRSIDCKVCLFRLCTVQKLLESVHDGLEDEGIVLSEWTVWWWVGLGDADGGGGGSHGRYRDPNGRAVIGLGCVRTCFLSTYYNPGFTKLWVGLQYSLRRWGNTVTTSFSFPPLLPSRDVQLHECVSAEQSGKYKNSRSADLICGFNRLS